MKEKIISVVCFICSVLAGLAIIHIILLHQPESANQVAVSATAIVLYICTFFIFRALWACGESIRGKQPWGNIVLCLMSAAEQVIYAFIFLWILMHTCVSVAHSGRITDIAIVLSRQASTPGSLMTWDGVKISLFSTGVMWLAFVASICLACLLPLSPKSRKAEQKV